jgi:hypothetical protein
MAVGKKGLKSKNAKYFVNRLTPAAEAVQGKVGSANAL